MKPFSPKYMFKKHIRGCAFTAKEKQIILNVYSFFRKYNVKSSVEKIIECTAAACGVSKTAVYNLKKESKDISNGQATELKDGRYQNKTPNREHLREYPEWVESAIRNKIHREFFQKNLPPTLRKLHVAVRSDPTLPNITLGALHKMLLKIGFVYKSQKRNAVFMERPDILEWRHRYLRAIRKYRKEGRPIVYSDETWVNAGHVVNKTWQDTSIKSSKQAFMEGLTTGLKQPSGKGERLIITHAGTPDGGFIPNAGLIFRAKRTNGDYHGEMNSSVYEDWFETKLLPNVPPHSVIVLDNAPYHTAKVELIA